MNGEKEGLPLPCSGIVAAKKKNELIVNDPHHISETKEPAVQYNILVEYINIWKVVFSLGQSKILVLQ